MQIDPILTHLEQNKSYALSLQSWIIDKLDLVYVIINEWLVQNEINLPAGREVKHLIYHMNESIYTIEKCKKWVWQKRESTSSILRLSAYNPIDHTVVSFDLFLETMPLQISVLGCVLL